jgi:DNA modification methylase
MTYKLICRDCMTEMHKLPNQCAALAFVDPPYNVGKDYGDYKDNLPEDIYFSWCFEWITELNRVAKTIAIYPPKIHLLRFWNMIPDNHLIICAWSPAGAIRSNFIHQYIPLLVPPKPLILTKDHWWNVQVPGLGYFYKEKTYDHPGQTSLDITRRVILSFTRPNDLVIDCFSGTGTTLLACEQLGRDSIGIDISSEYIKIAESRLQGANIPLPMEVI